MHRTSFVFGFSLVGLLFIGCISTTIVYNPNVHQTGRTAGRGNVKVKAAVSAVSAIQTGDVYDDSTRRDEIETQLPAADLQPAFELGLRYGASDHVDLGLDGCGSLNSFGVRAYGKFQLTNRAKANAVALMPAVVLLMGSHDKEEPKDADAATEEISSSAVAFELHLPISVRTGPRTEFSATPRLLSLHYTANYESRGPNPALHNLDLEDRRDLLGAGLGLGFRWGVLHPEASISAFDESAPFYALSMAVVR